MTAASAACSCVLTPTLVTTSLQAAQPLDAPAADAQVASGVIICTCCRQPCSLYVLCCAVLCCAVLPALQFFRGRQLNKDFMWTDKNGNLQPLSFADVLATAAIVSVRQCSGQALNITHTYGRKDATVADDHPLPSPGGVIEDRHNSIFQQMVGHWHHNNI